MASLRLRGALGGLLLVLVIAQSSGARRTALLTQVQAVCRHGGRSPRGTYPADPYRNVTWQGGFGSLLPAGVGDQVRLGALLRSRYGAALRLQSCQRISVISSDRDRTRESARALLHGLFQDTELGELEYQGGPLPPADPICPIRVIPERDDFVLRLVSPERCPRLILAIEAMLKRTPEYRDLVPLLKRVVAEHADIPSASSIDLVNVFDIFRTQQLSGLEIPEWAHQSLGSGLPTVYAALERFFFLAFGSQGAPSTRSLSAGGLLRTMVDTARDSDTALRLYAAHDTTLAALEAALGVYSGPLPTSSCLLLEVFAAADGARFVRLLRRSGSSGELRELPLGSRRGPCPLTKLEELRWLPDSVDDVKRMCRL
ncbi:testicular acid phosphatase homolog [Amphibalanus amphitrite]|uniref:testicular acid phosphatase homolog n=1 Tax=Amphibalanus amphitrite TaxID=1232801 RepID=UPI001C91CC89|nr:testicular acid phosphatase homolog [Amphibalanus amphitrite]